MAKSTLLYSLLTLVGGISALELATGASASATAICPLFVMNALNMAASGRSALRTRVSRSGSADLLWIDDFEIPDEPEEPSYCAPNHAHFAVALCVYFATITTLYRRYQTNQQLRNFVMAACIGLPFLVGGLAGYTIEYISVAVVPVMAWAGLATLPAFIWLSRRDMIQQLGVSS